MGTGTALGREDPPNWGVPMAPGKPEIGGFRSCVRLVPKGIRNALDDVSHLPGGDICQDGRTVADCVVVQL